MPTLGISTAIKPYRFKSAPINNSTPPTRPVDCQNPWALVSWLPPYPAVEGTEIESSLDGSEMTIYTISIMNLTKVNNPC